MNKQNADFLENAYINFDYNVAEGDMASCLCVIEDIRSAGFEHEARILTNLLREMPLNRFSIPSPYAI